MFDASKIKCPLVAVDAVIQMKGTNYICFIKRKFPPLGIALPGGFVDHGETLESAVIREVKEETDLAFIIVSQLRVRSEPYRDPRDHIISIPFYGIGIGEPKPLDDANGLILIHRTDAVNQEFAFHDHKAMVLEYIFKCE